MRGVPQALTLDRSPLRWREERGGGAGAADAGPEGKKPERRHSEERAVCGRSREDRCAGATTDAGQR